jgi:uncharacterized protein
MSGLDTRMPGEASAPLHKIFTSSLGRHLLVVRHSSIFDVPDALAEKFADGEAVELLDALSLTVAGEDSLDIVPEPSPQSISLNVSSSCNLSCTYCYADQGSFRGAQPSPMHRDVARAAVDRLCAGADPTAPITIGFLGGEPFVNRKLMHEVVAYASRRAETDALDIRFSVTTNGTLLEPEDIALLRDHPFAVTISLDGGAEVQNEQRPTRGGGRSFERVIERVAPLLASPGRAKIAARATVARTRLDLAGRFTAIRGAGFPEVGFAPLRSAATGALTDADWPDYLDALVELARSELARAKAGGAITLTNFAVALKQLHRGASAPYPCGAGGGYFSVAHDGAWYACHRAVGQADYRLGDNEGMDARKRRDFLERRHVHAQPECRACWARYLCSGGCHQEAATRTVAACDYIRGWLEFCLSAYCELVELQPGFFRPRKRLGSPEV